MVNYKMLKENIEEGLSYIKEQQEKNRPIIDALTKVLIEKLPEADLTFKEALSFIGIFLFIVHATALNMNNACAPYIS